MSTLIIKPGPIKSKVEIPSSKSYANRVLILAALRSEANTIKNVPQSSDVINLLDALEKIGLLIEKSEDKVVIKNSFPECESEGQTIEIGEGGTTARFLASMLLRGKKTYTLLLGERLKDRPWDEFINFVNEHHGQASLSGRELKIQGPLKLPRRIEIDCSKTTQFATGIRLAFPETNVIPVNMESSESYWKMTEKIMKDFQFSYNFTVPLDWSSASYPMAFAALNHKIEFPGLKYDEFQADAKFYLLLKKFDCITESPDGIVVEPTKHSHDVQMDVSDCLDLVPTLAYFLAHVEGFHELTGIKNLVHKESDRLNEVIKLLKAFGRNVEVRGDSLFMQGSHEKLASQIDLNMPDDHRMVMAGTLFLRHHAGGSITPKEAVSKSYPGFFDLLAV